MVFLVCPKFVLLDLAGPWDVFHCVNAFAGLPRAPYSLEVVTATTDLRVETQSNLACIGHRSLADCKGTIDTLIVPAAFGFEQIVSDPALLRRFRLLAERSRRVMSVCGGAFLLAAAGLLDGRRATTHWRYSDVLARLHPAVKVEPDRIFVKDGKIYTSAGVTAGIDLALALVEEDLGREVALQAAQNLVMFVRRPGGQTQFNAALESQKAERKPLRDLLAWAADHLAADLSVEAMAERAHMSLRNFSRVFTREVGKSPAHFVERLRVDAARQRLEELETGLAAIADQCGFGSANSMRRSFLRVLGVLPTDYRDRFRSATPERCQSIPDTTA
jgi:transcriptional regulator GlxA family with amidase domain